MGIDDYKVFRLQFLIGSALVILAATVIYFVFSSLGHSMQIEKVEDLQSVAEPVRAELAAWTNSYQHIASTIAGRVQLSAGQILSLGEGAQAPPNEIQMYLGNVVSDFGFKNIIIVTSQGELLYAAKPEGNFDVSQLEDWEEAVATGETQTSLQVPTSEKSEKPDITILVPVFPVDGISRGVSAVVVFLIDPDRSGFPMPGRVGKNPSYAQALVVPHEKDASWVMSNGTIRKIAHRADYPAPFFKGGRKVNGKKSPIYIKGRNLQVAYPIPGTPWRLITELNAREMLGLIPALERKTVIIFVLIVSLATMFSVHFFQARQQKFASRRFESEMRQLELENRFEFLTKHASDIIFLSDARGRILETNKIACVNYGYSETEWNGLSFHDLFAEQEYDASMISKKLSSSSHASEAVFRTKHQRKDGSIFPVEVRATIIELEGRSWRQFIVKDLTDLIRTQEELVTVKHRLAASLHDRSEGYWLTGFDWKVLFVNEVALRRTGLPAEQLLNSDARELSLGPEHDKIFGQLAMVMENRVVKEFDFYYEMTNGSKGWTRVVAKPVKEGILMLTSNISEQKMNEDLARVADILIDKEMLVLYQMDRRQGAKMTYVSEQVSLFGYKPDDIVGSEFFNFIHPNEQTQFNEGAARIFERGVERGAIRYRLRTKSGDYRWIEDRFRIFCDPMGEITNMDGVFILLNDELAGPLSSLS